MVYPKFVGPLAGESLMSLISRTSIENDLGGVGNVLKDIGHELPVGEPMSEVALQTLAERTNLDIETLRRMHVSTEVSKGAILSAADGAASIRPHLCPCCFGDAAYHRLAWHMRAMTHCPLHGIPMLDRCRCGKLLLWTRAGFLGCSCGCPFAEQEPKGRTIDAKDLIGLRVLAERCGEPFPWTPITPLMPKRFRSLSLSDLARALRILGHVAAYNGSQPLKSFGAIAPDGVPLVSHGLRIITDWPARFDEALDKHPSTGTKTVLAPKLQQYLTNVLRKERSKGTAIILKRLQRYLSARGYFGSFSLQPDGECPAHLMSLDAAADMLGVSRPKMTGFARTNHLWDPKEADGPYARWCVRSKVEILVEKKSIRKPGATVVSMSAAATRLGVIEPHIRELAAFGVFGPNAQARFELEPTYRFLHKAEIDGMVRTIKAALSPVPAESLTAVTWCRTSSTDRPNNFRLGAVVRGVLEGQIVPAAFDGTLRSLRFDRTQLSVIKRQRLGSLMKMSTSEPQNA